MQSPRPSSNTRPKHPQCARHTSSISHLAACALPVVGLLAMEGAHAQDALPAAWTNVRPLLERTCYECHSDKKTKGGVDLKKLDADPKVSSEFVLWAKVQEVVANKEMPPEDAKASLDESGRKTLLGWVGASLEKLVRENEGDPGPVTLRRLTNAEYDNTIRDLSGIDFRLGREFTPDGGGGEGFSNLGDVLFVNPQQLDKYFAAARKIADHAAILPGTGIHFQTQRVGLRGPSQMRAGTESTLYRWYQEASEKFLPKDGEDLREGEYMLACWKWKHRELTGAQSLEALAKEAGLSVPFLENWWSLFQKEDPKSRFLDLTRVPWRALPAPDPAKPKEIPDAVSAGIAAIRAQRVSWLVPQGWPVQRAQQDADGIRPYPLEAAVNGERWVHLVFGDLADGNKGDWVLVEQPEIQLKGKFTNYWDWLSNQAGADRQAVQSAKASGSPEPADAQARLDAAEAALGMLGKHPGGRPVDAKILVVQAPKVLRLPLPEGTQRFKAKGRLDLNHPDAEFATVQWTATTAQPPDPTKILPGVLTIWKRQTKAQGTTMGDFNVMKMAFPDSMERRLEEVARNFHRNGKGAGVYYLNDTQLLSLLPPDEGPRLQKRLTDWRFVSNPNLPDTLKADWDKAVLEHLHAFAGKAWRRPLAPEEKEQLTRIYREGLAKELDRESAAREVLVRVLVAPSFLFKLEEGATPGIHPLTPWELATRLSYFLWSSTPDGALLEKAGAGALNTREARRAEVLRMLKDPRARALAKEFAGQWFEIHNFDQHLKVDGSKFPEFTPELRADLYEEAVAFFSHLVLNDRPVREILEADYSFLNGRLAKFYGVPNVEGDALRLTHVDAQGRGGLLGMAALLTKTSYPHRTSPVLRGNWILHNVLGTPTPAPPNDVPKLDDSVAAAKTLRERLERHRADRACSVCHDKIDPLGFALEGFDAIGRTRAKDESGAPIDDSAKTKDGQTFQGVKGLRHYLEGRRAEFYALFARKLAGYALGRSVLPTDKPLLEQIQKTLLQGDGSFSSAVLTVVESKQFENRRNE